MRKDLFKAIALGICGADEDTLHNEMYFDQFLAWFGTSLMTGVFIYRPVQVKIQFK